MTEVKGLGRRRITQLLDGLRNRRHWELRRKLKIEIGGNESLSHEHKEEIHILLKSMDLLIRSTLHNNNNNVSMA